MTDKEFRHLRRIDLIEIIYKLQEEQEELQKQIDDLKGQLEKKELDLAEAGSIAEAALRLNDVFGAAQAAADQYLAEIKRMHAKAAAQEAARAQRPVSRPSFKKGEGAAR